MVSIGHVEIIDCEVCGGDHLVDGAVFVFIESEDEDESRLEVSYTCPIINKRQTSEVGYGSN